MRRILIVSNMYPDKKNPFYGTFVKNFCCQLNELNIEYDLSVMTKKNGKIRKIIGYTGFYIKTFLKCILGQYKYIYIHYASFSSPPVLWARKFKDFDIYVNVHGSDVLPLTKRQKKMQIHTERVIELAKCIVVPSDYFMNVVVSKYKIRNEYVLVYPSGGVDLNKFKVYKHEEINFVKRYKGLNPNLCCVGFVSRLNQEKGWDTYLNAVKKIVDDGYECEFIMVGSGKDEMEVQRLIERNGLKDKIHRFPQQAQDDLVDFFNIIDIFAFPTSLSESLGLVAIEAMACGCPVIASDYAAPGSYVIDGVNGLKFPKGDNASLAYCIENFLNMSIAEQERMKKGACSTAEEYSTDKIIKRLKFIMSLDF